VTGPEAAIEPSRGVFDDVRHYFLHRPGIPTLVHYATDEELQDYTHRIAQRVGIDVSQYSVLNVHRIGIEAPVRYVFEEILSWEGDSPCWPNQVATFETLDPQGETVRVILLGGWNPVGGWARRLFGPQFGTLFNMRTARVQLVPSGSDLDNARYLLWECSGGYPIGIFSIYVRSAIAERRESESTQVFFAVGFNPYGRKILSRIHPVRRTWEAVHNRVTGNVLNRFKRVCESGFRLVQDGSVIRTSQGPPAAERG
jgi:hypothetical protein